MKSVSPVKQGEVTQDKEDNASQNSNPNEDGDAWEKVSYTDLNLDGMNDPFQNKFENLVKEYQKVSNFSIHYDSWSLKMLIVKANDDLR